MFPLTDDFRIIRPRNCCSRGTAHAHARADRRDRRSAGVARSAETVGTAGPTSQAGQGQGQGQAVLVLAAADRPRRALGRKTRRARRFRMADRPPGSHAGAGSGPSGRPHRRCGCGRRTRCGAAALEAGSRASGRLPCHNRPGSSPRRSLHPGHGRGAPAPSFRQAGRCIPQRSGPRRPRDGDRGRFWPDQGHRPGKGCGYSTPGAAPRRRALSAGPLAPALLAPGARQSRLRTGASAPIPEAGRSLMP